MKACVFLVALMVAACSAMPHPGPPAPGVPHGLGLPQGGPHGPAAGGPPNPAGPAAPRASSDLKSDETAYLASPYLASPYLAMPYSYAPYSSYSSYSLPTAYSAYQTYGYPYYYY